jgi:hypothetical protein
MSYTLQVQNGTQYEWTGSDGANVPPGATWQPQHEPLGNAWISSSQLGTINFLDIADQHIPGDSKETWGVLISYQGEEMVGRYEGGGTLKVALNGYGQATPSGMDLRQVSLPAFVQQETTFE